MAGTRLALYGFVLEDGTEQVYPYDWFDRELGEQCVKEQWSDGATYCTPFSTSVVYRDPSCTAEVARISPSLSVGLDYARVLFTTSNGPRLSRLRVLGDPVVVTGSYYTSDAGSCTAHSADDGATFRAITDRTLGADAFVRIRRLADDAEGRFAGLREVGDDGMVVPIGFHDRELGIDCAAAGFANTDTAQCAPLNPAPASYYTDATCETPSVSAEYAGDDAIELDGACPRYFAFSEQAPSELYDGTPDHCVAATPGGTYYAAGPELELGTMARTRSMTATKRYTPIALGDPRLHILDTLVHDNVLDVDCEPSFTGTCMPVTAGYVASLFADAACTQPIQLAYVPPDCGVHATLVGTDTALYAIGPAFTGTAYTISTGDICAKTLPLANLELHELGPSIALSQVGKVTYGVLP